ncbi:MAG TPA: phosphatidylglycerol lysyltransferase domain-containing protein [Trebonia sp.]|jgi:lysyl-tRNA synthetase class 2|nr:phosphatidylglycerol lysyltransferase domain-containing protein [Trebonia sp.]
MALHDPGPDKRLKMSESNAAERAGRGGKADAPGVRKHRRWVPAIASLLTLLIGLSNILAIFKPAWQDKLHRINAFVPGTLTNVAHSADVVVGLLLLLLSQGLRRRKRRAWQAVLALLGFDVLVHLWYGQRPYSTVVAVILAAVLLFFADDFYAIGDPRTRWHALGVFIGLITADLVIGLGFLASGGLAGEYTFRERVHSVVFELVGASGPVSFVSDARSDLYGLLTGALGLFTLVVTIYMFLRPAEPRARLGEANEARIRGLLAKYGDRDSLGYFALRTDKNVIWSPSGKSCICYRVVSGVMLAAADPIGDPEAWPGAIAEFLSEADRHAWRPAVMGCSELGAEVWCREGGLTALELGDEAIVQVADFSLSGRAMRNVRQMVNRVAKSGYTAEVRRVGDIPRDELREIIRASESWRGSQTERGFSMALGRIGGIGDADCVLVTALENGVLRAVLHFVPWGGDGLSLDLMRRDRNAQGGLNDFLIVESIKGAPELGVKRISLNFAMFRAVLERGERIGAGPVLRTWRSMLLFASRWFQIESLYKFNAKFSPEWQPRFFVFPGGGDMPRIALAALEAEAFLVWPSLQVRRAARRAGRLLGVRRIRRLRARRRSAVLRQVPAARQPTQPPGSPPNTAPEDVQDPST